jgi:purine-binding chemotaxis protein CheW
MSDSTSLSQIVIFSLAGEEYALPISHVQEIIRYSQPRPVTTHEPWIRGVISLRGKIVPVCDLAVRLGSTAGDAPSANIVIVETAEGTAGMIVDDVDEVLTIDTDQLEPVPSSGADFLQGIAKVGDRLVVMLDPDRLLAGSRISA